MRHSASTQLIESEDGVVSGILLEHNYCAEHEWGVKDLRRQMNGMSDAKIEEKRVCDMSRIQVALKAEDIIFHEEKGLVIMGVDDGLRWMGNWRTNEAYIKRYKLKPNFTDEKVWGIVAVGLPDKITTKNANDSWVVKRQTVSAWDGGSFGIATREPKVMDFLRDLRVALQKGDVVLHISGTSNPFKPVSGLVLAILSRIPQEQKDGFKAGHEDLLKLAAAAEATGIEKKLKAAGKTWFALSPEWAGKIKSTKDGEIQTKYSVIYWLNPMDQKDNNSCWTTVENLELWIKGEGTIPKRVKVGN